MKSSDEQKSNSVPAGAGPLPPVQPSPVATHSVGPWKACHDGECRCGMIWDGSGNIHVATAHDAAALGRDHYGSDWACNPDVRKANACLIAAAPDLLAALMWLLEHPACQASYSEDAEMARRVDRGVTAVLKAGVELPDEWPTPSPSKAEA